MLPPPHKRIHTLNERFFEKLTPESAYVFGFWMADGYIHHCKHYKISFSSKDTDHLENVKLIMGSNTQVYHGKKGTRHENCSELCLYSKKLFYDIIGLGGCGKKSNVLKFPKIPESLLPDFIRGYFDGDGSVHFVSYLASKNKKLYREMRSNFTCGSKIFLESIREKLHKRLGLAWKAIGQYGPHQFKLGYGVRDSKKLLGFMYYSGNKISLERKAAYRLLG